MPELDLYLIKPTKYDDEGYPLRWWRSMIPSNSLACVHGIVMDAINRGVPGPDVKTNVFTLDEFNAKISIKDMLKRARKTGNRTVVFLVGVQTNQFPRAVDIARPLLDAGLQVCVGGFHVSGCVSMLDEMPEDIKDAQAMGLSMFTGEAEEGRLDQLIVDGWNGALKPMYDYVNDTPNLAGAALPHMPLEQTEKVINRYSSFDLGRGCPFECSFCTIINVQGRKSRFRTPDDLEQIIRDNAAIGIDRFFLTDDNFARNKAWRSFTERMIKLRKEEGLAVKLAIQVDVLAHKIDGFIEQCVEAGADQIFIGLENINAANLELVKKRQNRIEEYREMFMAWKQHQVVISCGYIIGFPMDTKESIARDIEVIKSELPIDTLYLNYLTPLPGSEDHKNLYETGIWMDPDMAKYDLNHRVTHHAMMSDEEWEEAYLDAHLSFYSWDHMETIIKRMAALKSNKKLVTINRLMMYRESVRVEGVSAMESGFIRMRGRKDRRHGMKIENPIVFYPKFGTKLLVSLMRQATTYGRLRLILRRVLKDKNRTEYTDQAIKYEPSAGRNYDILLDEDHLSDVARKRIEKRDQKAAAQTA